MGNLNDFRSNYQRIGTHKSSVDFDAVAQAARGHWRELLTRLNVDAHSLHGKHCACPGCGGKDRFRFDDKDGNGTFVCSQGGGELLAGDGFILLEHVHGWNRSQSFQAVKEALGMERNPAPMPTFPGPGEKKAPEKKINYRKELSKVKETWSQSKPLRGTPAETYLESRGILTDTIPVDAHLRFHPWLTQYQKTDTGFAVIHDGPAMVALVTNIHEEILGIHKSFLQPDGSGKATISGGNAKFLKKCAERMNGGAVRIFPVGENGMIGIGEGIESVLAGATIARKKGGILPVWAALNTTLLADWIPPAVAKNIAILADNDAAGLKAARQLQERMRQFRPDAQTDILTPPYSGMDWNDALIAQNRPKTASP